jgi:CheY-like chemotaxis protein
MTEPDNSAVTFRVHLHQHIARLRGFARILAGKQKWADLCVVQLLEDLLTEPRLFNLATTPRVALYSRLLHLLSIAPQETALSEQLLVTPAARQAHLLTTVEGFTIDEAAEALSVSVDQLEDLLQDAELALAHQRGARIMIVEDEAFIALELEFLVDGLGHDYLDTATTRSEAVDKAILLKPDLILSDVQLADGGSGIEAAQMIKKHFDIPIVFITANPEQLLTGKRPEPVFLMKKPFNKTVVQALISQALFLHQKDIMRVHEPAGLVQC